MDQTFRGQIRSMGHGLCMADEDSTKDLDTGLKGMLDMIFLLLAFLLAPWIEMRDAATELIDRGGR